MREQIEGHRPDHPWLSMLIAAPLREVGRLLAGKAPLGGLSGADIRSAAKMLVGQRAGDDEARVAFDTGLSLWLAEVRVASLPANEIVRIAYEASDALAIAGIIRLPLSGRELRDNMEDWFSWCSRIGRYPSSDVRLELLFALASTQSVVVTSSSGRAFELEPLWMNILAGGSHSSSDDYISVALLGLRMLPERPGSVPERLWLSGLVHWARHQRPTYQHFGYHWRALRTLYPRTKTHWKTQVGYVLQQQEMPPELRDFWRNEIGNIEATLDGQVPDEAWRAMSSAHKFHAMLSRAGDPIDTIEPEIRNEIAARVRFAEVTGLHYYLTSTCCNLGMRLIEAASPSESLARGRLAAELALTTLRWSVDDPFGWALWRDALEMQGAYEAAELVGWEAVRRYPENVQFRGQLGMLLYRMGRVKEARDVMADTLKRFPQNDVARCAMAEAMIAADQVDEAEVLLKAFLGLATEATCYSVLARIAAHKYGAAAAIDYLHQGLRRHPESIELQRQLDAVSGGGDLTLVAAQFRLPESTKASSLNVVLPRSTSRGGKLRRIGSRLAGIMDPAAAQESLREVREVLRDAPNHEYGRYLESELSGDLSDGADSAFSIAFRRALETKDADSLDILASRFPERKLLVHLASAVFVGSQIDGDLALSWLRMSAGSEPRPVAAIREFVRLRLGEGILVATDLVDLTAADLVSALAANDNFRIDLFEAALVPSTALLAA